MDTRVYRPYESAGILLVADGAMEVTPDGDTLGYGALVADAAGVLATVASVILTRAASPWAAEWVGKLEAWRRAETLAVQHVGADCTSATLGGERGAPSQFPWVDRVPVAFAEALGRGQPDLYVLAHHNTQWSGLICGLQARAHDLAATGLGMAREGTYPFLSSPDGTA